MAQIIVPEVTLVFVFHSEVEILSTNVIGHIPMSPCTDFLRILATSMNVITTSDFDTDIIKKKNLTQLITLIAGILVRDQKLK